MTWIIRGWTPKTNLLLHGHCGPSNNNNNSDDTSRDHHSGYDIIDHAFGYNFPLQLLKELQTNGWIDATTRNGVTEGRLKPARTKMDVDVDNLLQNFINPFMDNGTAGTVITPSSSNNGSVGSGATRGDVSAFIPRQERMKNDFAERYPILHKLVSSIEATACKYLGKNTNTTHSRGDSNLRDGTSLSYFQFDKSLTSVQVAKYPGDGIAGYPRHCDRGATCLNEPATSSTRVQPGKDETQSKRLLTFVYYLTPTDWDEEIDGGALRMFAPKSNHENDSTQHSNGAQYYFDATPYSDRLVVFRSDIIEHQVMPSLRRDRIAVTVWLYGKVVYPGLDAEVMTSLPSNKGTDSMCSSSSSALPPALPLPSGSVTGDKTIYVAIPSYRDAETWPTIKSLVETARHPQRIFIGVVFQVDTESQDEVHRFTTVGGSGISFEQFEWSHETNFRCMILDYRNATGPCYARHLAQTLHCGEDYILQIDSHMRCRPNWDEYLIQQLNKTESPSNSVLTAYPPGYEPPDGPGPSAETRTTILVPWKFGQEDGMLRQKGRLIRDGYQQGSNNDNIPCLLYAGGFNFFHASLLDICPYDYKLHELFFGEEISMAVRLYTNGVDLFAPPQTVCYHLWTRNPLRVRKDDDSKKKQQRKDALEAVRMQLRGQGRGLGTVRSVEQFWMKLGVDFEEQTLAPGCEKAGLKEEAFVSSGSPSTTDCGEATTGNNLSGDDLSSVLKLVGQFMNQT